MRHMRIKDCEQWVESLYREEYVKMVAYASNRIQNEDQAQDLTQETFKLLCERADILQEHPNIRGWLWSALKNKILSYWKSGQGDLKRFVLYDENGAQIPGGPSAEDVLFELTEDEILAAAKRRLSRENYRHLVRLTVDRASHATVAKEFGISIEASQKRLERSRIALQKDFPEWRRKKMKKMSAFDVTGNIEVRGRSLYERK